MADYLSEDLRIRVIEAVAGSHVVVRRHGSRERVERHPLG